MDDYDVAKPKLTWVQNKCYRVNPSRNDYGLQNAAAGGGSTAGALDDMIAISTTSSSTRISAPTSSTLPYREHDDMTGCDPDEADYNEDQYEVEQVGGGFITNCTEIPNTLFGSVIGTKGAVKKRIEMETNTTIQIPRMHEKGLISIRGKKREDVVRARRRIRLIADQSRFRQEATHFLCFPLNSQSLIQNAREFKNKVLADFKTEGIGVDETIFQEPEKIHLTLSVLMLLDQAERTKAVEILESLKPEILEVTSKGNLRCRVQGIEIMNDDSSAANILFAKCVFPDNNQTVQVLADFIHQKFLATGFAKASRADSVKLHATLLNTRYRQEKKGEGGESRDGNHGFRDKKMETFNAKPILDRYSDYDFGFVEIKEIHISTRHFTGPDGFYKPSGKLRLKD